MVDTPNQFRSAPAAALIQSHTHTHFGDKQSTEKTGLDALGAFLCEEKQGRQLNGSLGQARGHACTASRA